MSKNESEYLITVSAANCPDAYDKAVFEAIPALKGQCPYSAWVESTLMKNSKTKWFNTFEGKPY